MQAEIITHAQGADWDRFVYSNPDVISWHIYDWYKVAQNSYNVPYYPIAVYDGSDVCGILPLYEVNTRRTGRALISVPYFVAGGIVAPEKDVRQALLHKAIALADEKQVPLTLKQYKTKLDGDLVTDASYFNRELTLTPDTDAIWQALAPENRAKVEEAQQSDLRLEYPSSNFDAFYKLLLDYQHSLGMPCPTRKWVKTLNSQMYVMALLWQGKKLVAATFVKVFKDTVSLPMMCYAPGHEKSEVFLHYLYWELIKRLADDGVRILHSGRIPDGEDVPAFRLGWGGEPHRYYYQYYGRSGGATESSSKRGRKRELFSTAWRLTPKPITQIISPILHEQFP